mgnify:CR=1 FL=1
MKRRAMEREMARLQAADEAAAIASAAAVAAEEEPWADAPAVEWDLDFDVSTRPATHARRFEGILNDCNCK